MTYSLRSLTIPFLALLISGCTTQPSKDVVALPHEMTGKLDTLNKEVEQVKAQLKAVQRRIFFIESSQRAYKTASFDVASAKGYQRLDTTTGSFLVSLENAQPYLNGYKLTFHIGNPSAAEYEGFKLTTKWGPEMDVEKVGTDDSYFEKWQAAQHEKTTSFTEQLRPGTWNRVQVVVAPATAEQLSNLELSMETNTVLLLKK